MLSKSQARTFFLVATLGFSGVFLALTVDTIRQVPERSNADRLTAEVVHGKELWDTNNCMGCHTLLGEGAYYAPELTKVVERRGTPWLRMFLKDPQAMYPGRRKMVQYDFTDGEIDAVIAFLDWVGQIDTNGFPPAPDLGPAATPATRATVTSTTGTATVTPAPPMFEQVCVACHQLGGRGGAVGPALDGLSARFDAATLRKWLVDPQSVKPGTAMPKLPLTEADLDSLTTFLLAR